MKNKLKQGFEVTIRLILTLTIIFTNFGFVTDVFADSYSKGEVINPTHTIGSTTNDGDVELTKTVTPSTEEGVFDVTLTAKGNNKEVTQSQTGSIYTAVVIDTSGSMDDKVCTKRKWELVFIFYIPVGCEEYSEGKYENAVAGAVDFSDTLLGKYPNAQLALVGFDSDVELLRDFDNKKFSDGSDSTESDFPATPNGGTNLGAAIKQANDLLMEKKSKDPNAILYMVVLSDGYPEGQTINHNTAANAAKANGIEIFTIGYDVNNDTRDLLKGIATSEEHFRDADGSDIADHFSDIASSITVPVPAGTNATITDVIAPGFTYVEGSANPNTATIEGQTITFDIGNIPEGDGVTVSFKIKINKDLEDGQYRTNEYAKVEYTNTDNRNDEKKIEESAKVYWEQQKYTYVVNYYKDTVDEDNSLGTETGTNIAGYEVTLSDLTKLEELKPTTGYQDGVIVTTNNKVSNEINSPLIVNVVYNKKNTLSYTVKYYKDSLTNEQISNDSDNTFNNQTYKDLILDSQINKNKYLPTLGYQSGVVETDMPYEILDGENVIKVCYYKRTDMEYTVKYIEKGTNNEILKSKNVTNRTFEETYEETAKEAPFGYVLSDNATKTITVDSDNKELVFNYEKRDNFSYTVKYLEKDTNITLSTEVERTNKTYLETYTETALNISGYNLVGDATQDVVIDSEDKIVTFYYTKKTNLSYTVNYYKDSVTSDNKLGSTTVNNQTFKHIVEVNDININKYKPTSGYQDGVIVTSMPYEIEDGENVINVLYSKKDNLNYVVRYYLDSTSTTQISEDSENTISNKIFEELVYANEININKYKPTSGYQDGVVVTSMPYEIQDGTNVIEVVYSKKDNLSYTVEYYKDGVKISIDSDNTVDNQVFGNLILEQSIEKNKYKPLLGYKDGTIDTDMPYQITDGSNIIKVSYVKRTDMEYTVKYIEKGTNNEILESKNVTNRTFEETYEETAKEAPFGYVLSDNATKTITVDSDNKELVFNYEKRDNFSYTVKYLEKDTNITLSTEVERTNKTYLETYTETALNISGYNLVGDATQDVVIDSEDKIVTFYYTKKTNLSYTVNYYKDSITNENKFNTETINNQTFNTIITSDEISVSSNTPYGYTNGTIVNTMPYTIIDGENVIEVLYSKRTDMKYIVKFIDKATQEELNSRTMENKTYLEIYTETVEEDEVPFGYNLIGESTKEVLMDEDGKIIIFEFEKRNDFSYKVNYLEEGSEEVLSPSKEESGKTYLESYTEEALEIPGYNLVGEKITQIAIKSDINEITFYYTKKTDLTYRVEYYYDGIIDSSKTEVFENQVFGTVINNYVEKQPYGYEFVSDTAPLTIEDTEDNVIKVYYESIPQGEITPPKTGIDNTNNYISFIYLISTLGFIFISRKQEN